MHKIGKQTGCIIIQATVLVMCLQVERVAFADDDIPDACMGTYEKSAYLAGKSTGEALVTKAWAMIDDCDRIEYFEYVVVDLVKRLTLPPYAPLTTACRYAGYVNGVMGKIPDIYKECEMECYQDGEIIGEIAAIAYCELSISLGGLAEAGDFMREPVQMCGFHFEFACDVTFMFTTFTYSNSSGSCIEYTEDPFFEVWDQVRYNQCAYDIDIDIIWPSRSRACETQDD